MLKQDKNGIDGVVYDFEKKNWKQGKVLPQRGKGTIAYTVRRIQMLEDKLKELKADLKAGKYDVKR